MQFNKSIIFQLRLLEKHNSFKNKALCNINHIIEQHTVRPYSKKISLQYAYLFFVYMKQFS